MMRRVLLGSLCWAIFACSQQEEEAETCELGAVESDQDCDGIVFGIDCDDSDASLGSFIHDLDCDGALNQDDCGSEFDITLNKSFDRDCDGVLAEDDCDDSDADIGSRLNDTDCDGVLTEDDCDDQDTSNTNLNDGDCDGDGLVSEYDCDDQDASDVDLSEDCDQDGILTQDDCDDLDSGVGDIDGSYGFMYEEEREYEGIQIEWKYNEAGTLMEYTYDQRAFLWDEFTVENREFDESDGGLLYFEKRVVYEDILSSGHLFQYDENKNLIHYDLSSDEDVVIQEEIFYEYDTRNNLIYSSGSQLLEYTFTSVSKIRYTYDENDVISSKQEYYDIPWGRESIGNTWMEFHSNGEVSFYRNINYTYSGIRMDQCSYDSTGHLILSSSVEYDDYTGDFATHPPPDCIADLSYEEIHSYLNFPSPAPLDDDGTSHTPIELSCTP